MTMKTTFAALLLAGTALAAMPAQADVILDTKLSGTGDNVVFNSLSGSLATGLLNGQHADLVRFTDLTGSTTFSAAASGNDIKITGSNNLFIQVFDPTGTFVVPTTTDVFSLKGTGDVTAFVQAIDINGNPEPIQTFSLGTIDPNAQSGFTFTAINGEQITSFRLLDLTGNINEFEHYRIDVGTPRAVPGPMVGAGIPGVVAAFAMMGLAWRRRRARLGLA
jgi:hypothetical protein